MAALREQPVADKERIFEELQDLVSDQLKVRYRLCMRVEPLPEWHVSLYTRLHPIPSCHYRLLMFISSG